MSGATFKGWFSNGGGRMLVQIIIGLLLAGGAWVKLTNLETAVAKQDVKIEQINATASQTNLTVNTIETRLGERIRIADKEHETYERRLDRLERKGRD